VRAVPATRSRVRRVRRLAREPVPDVRGDRVSRRRMPGARRVTRSRDRWTARGHAPGPPPDAANPHPPSEGLTMIDPVIHDPIYAPATVVDVRTDGAGTLTGYQIEAGPHRGQTFVAHDADRCEATIGSEVIVRILNDGI